MLIVIDMQAKFTAANDLNTISNIKSLLKDSVSKNEYILYLEYYGFGKTLEELTKITNKYEKQAIVQKYCDSGSFEIIRHLKSNKLYPKTFNICGVNTDMCVHDTISGLVKDLHNKTFNIHIRACNSESKGSRVFDKLKFLEFKGVNIIK